LPSWVYALPLNEKAQLLQGWLDSDGHIDSSGAWSATTTSLALAIGMARVCRDVYGRPASISAQTPPPTTVIQGRVVRQRPWYQVRFHGTPKRPPVAVVEGSQAWVPVKDVASGPVVPVFNIAVDQDESYVANGAVVHNCQPVSQAGKRLGENDERFLWDDVFVAVERMRPGWLVFENPPGLAPWLPAIISRLAERGYVGSHGVLPASSIGACHQRERIFIVAALAHPSSTGQLDKRGGVPAAQEQGRQSTDGRDFAGNSRAGLPAADADGEGRGQLQWIEPCMGARYDPDRCGPGHGALADADGEGRGRQDRGREQRSAAHEEGGWPDAAGADGLSFVARMPDGTVKDYGPAVRRHAAVLGRSYEARNDKAPR
jgi:hypothetical protein